MVEDNLIARIDAIGIKMVQSIKRLILFYARAVDITSLEAVSMIRVEQSKATEGTKQKMNQMMNYLATNPNTTVIFCASDMILKIHSECSYITALNARSKAGDQFYFGDDIPPKEDNKPNGSIYNEYSVLKMVAARAAEGKVGTLFVNVQK